METVNSPPASDDRAVAMASSMAVAETSLSDVGMDSFSAKDFVYALGRLAAVFQANAAITRETGEVYAKALESYSAEQTKDAIGKWLRTGTRFPYPADLISLIESDPA